MLLLQILIFKINESKTLIEMFLKDIWSEIEKAKIDKMCLHFQIYPKYTVNIQGISHTYRQLRLYLSDSKWITDTILNQYLYAFQTQNRVENTWICSSFEFEAMQRAQNIEHLVDKFCSFTKLIMPIHVANHWLCARFQPQNGQFFIYDSLNTRNEYVENVFHNFWEKVKSYNNWKTDLKIKTVDTPKQPDHNSCGLYCISNVKSLFMGLPLVDIRDELSEVRHNIMYTVLKKEFE